MLSHNDGQMAARPPSSKYSTTSSRGRSQPSTTDYSDSATSTSSCLVVPGFARRRGRNPNNKRGGGGKFNSAASTDLSSTTDQIFNPTAHNDRQSLLVRHSNQLTADWFDDEIAMSHMSHEASTSQQFHSDSATNPFRVPPVQQQRPPPPPAVVTPPSVGPSLLAFPEPKDRSHRARRSTSQQRGALHAYDGEMEPEGVRGQEAELTASPPVVLGNNNDLPLRTFTGTPEPLFRPSQEDYRYQEEDYGQEEEQEHAPPREAFQLRSQRLERATSGDVVDDLSATSSQDIESMMKTEFSGTAAAATTRTEPAVEYPRSDRSLPEPRQLQLPPAPQAQQAQAQQQSMRSRQDPPSPNFLPTVQQPPAQFYAPRKEEEEEETLTRTPTWSLQQPRQQPQRQQQSFLDESSLPFTEEDPYDFRVPRRSAPVNVDDSSFEDPGSNVQGIHAMAMEHVMKGEYDMALQAFSQVLSVYLEKHGRAHPLTASAYHNLGTVHSKRAGLLLDHTLHQRHCREQSLLCFQAAARSARDSPQLGSSHPNVAVSLVRIGFLLLQSRQYQNAVITFQEALRIRLDHYGAAHALVANLYNNLGVCHMHLQEFVVGRRYLQQALDIQKDLLGQDDFSTTALLELADTLCNIGGLCLEWIRQQGPDARHALDAESSFLEALEVRAKVLGENHALTNQVRSLHDMVRSIPLPKVSDKGANRSLNHNKSSVRLSRSPAFPIVNSPASPGRPYITTKTPSPIRPVTTSKTASPIRPFTTSKTASAGSRTPEALNLPTLKNQRELSSRASNLRPREDPPALEAHSAILRPSPPGDLNHFEHYERQNDVESNAHQIGYEENEALDDSDARVVPLNRSAQSELTSTLSSSLISDAELNAYEATEESCVLNTNTKQEDGQVTVVSYAQSTASWSSATRRETERLAYLMQAKAILDAHRDYMDSPQVTLDKHMGARQAKVQMQQPESVDDGLAPLGGVWPEVTAERISPEVLQNPGRHLKTIHYGACNFFKRGRYSEALHLLEIVVDVQRAKNGPVHEDVGAALHNVGIAELRLGENYKALQAFEEAVRVRKGSLGRDHPQVAMSLVKMGITLMLLKRLEDSLWIFREALTVRKHALGPLHPSTARIYNNIGCVHVEFGEPNEAKRAFEAALDIQRNALANDPESGPILFGAATTLQNLAYLYRKNQMHEKEALVLRESLGVS